MDLFEDREKVNYVRPIKERNVDELSEHKALSELPGAPSGQRGRLQHRGNDAGAEEHRSELLTARPSRPCSIQNSLLCAHTRFTMINRQPRLGFFEEYVTRRTH